MNFGQIKIKDIILLIALLVAITLIVVYSFDSKVKLSNNHEVLDFKAIKNKYFIQYYPKLKSFSERSGNVTAFMKIHRDILSEVEMRGVQHRLIADGWREIEHNDNYFAYCLSKNQLLSILSPVAKDLKTREGEIIHNDDIDSWIIGFYFSQSGIESCRKILN